MARFAANLEAHSELNTRRWGSSCFQAKSVSRALERDPRVGNVTIRCVFIDRVVSKETKCDSLISHESCFLKHKKCVLLLQLFDNTLAEEIDDSTRSNSTPMRKSKLREVLDCISRNLR